MKYEHKAYIESVHCLVVWYLGVKLHSYVTATQLGYRYIEYLSTVAQRNALYLKFIPLQYRNAVVRAEMDIQPLQLNVTQMQWNMNKKLILKVCTEWYLQGSEYVQSTWPAVFAAVVHVTFTLLLYQLVHANHGSHH